MQIHDPQPRALILGVATANPPHSYSQQQVLEFLGVTDRRVKALFLNSAIERRHLMLPSQLLDGSYPVETQGELLLKHRTGAVSLGCEAIRKCVTKIGASLSDINYLCCVTTTGFMSPGLSALICRELQLRRHCGRLDVVGMGCNAGLNALNATSNWALANPGKLAITLCVEICSAGYVVDGSMRSAVVNSLFGDGAAAVAVSLPKIESSVCASLVPELIGFYTQNITEAIDAMRFDWDDSHGKFSFFLDPEIPYVVGANAEATRDGLLAPANLRHSDIRHWIIHSGGKKVIDSIKVNLGLSASDVRHTTGVLRDFGNLSSGSFLFSYERLLSEGVTASGDYGVMMTMGPGSTIESALLRW